MTDREALEEKVARLYIDKWGLSDYWLADAAIDLVMEEAAEASRPPAHMLGSTDSYANGYRAACTDIAAALRAYVRQDDNKA